MRYIVISALLALLSAGIVYAGQHDVTPYGDYSEWCGAYGVCKENLGPREAENAIIRYFASKGCSVANIRHKGRFVEADIYRNNSLTDKILFDRKTGRVRSTY